MYSGRLGSNPFFQNAAHRGAPNAQAASDCGFARARTVELPYLVSVEGRCYRAAQALAVSAGVGQAGADSFPENLPFELGVLRRKAKRR